MKSLAKAQIIGNIGDIREIQRADGAPQKVVRLRVATNWMGRNQEKHTDWHTVYLYGENAENAMKILKVGDKIYVEGRLRSRSYKDANTNIERTVWEILGNDFIKLTPKSTVEETQQEESEGMELAPPDVSPLEVEDSIEEGGNNLDPQDLPF